MGIREAVAHSLLSTNLEHLPHECAIDRIGALARATDLGRALWHWGIAGDEGAVKSAFKHLLRKAQRKARVYKQHSDFGLLQRTCLMVLNEWKNKRCLNCGGAGEVETEKLKIVCHVCGGSGLHRFSDYERMDALEIESDKYKSWEPKIAMVWGCLSSADGGTSAVIHSQLARI